MSNNLNKNTQEQTCFKCEVVDEYKGKCEVTYEDGKGKVGEKGLKCEPEENNHGFKEVCCSQCGTKYFKSYSRFCHHCGKPRK